MIMHVSNFPYNPVDVGWKRPPIDRSIIKECSKKSNLKGLVHSLGVLAILGVSGGLSFWFFTTGQWVLMAVALYVHGAIFAFNPQTHELAHHTVFKSKWLNEVFKRIFGVLHWRANNALYWMSHRYHHRYTTHRQSEGEVVLPRAETTQDVLFQAIKVVDITGFLTAVYDQFYSLFRPHMKNPRRSVWERYVFLQAKDGERTDAYWTRLSQVLFHLAFAGFAIAIGQWFLIVVVSLPAFYGGRWYHTLVHDTMHVGRTPETNDFRDCCRSVKVDPFTSFIYWHMEWHTEHHTYPGIPCYNLKKFHDLTSEHWEKPQTLVQAWKEMNRESLKLIAIKPSAASAS
jgi:fatty acid desaturase